MKPDHFRAVADKIESDRSIKFKQAVWIERGPDCKSNACVAGYAASIAEPETWKKIVRGMDYLEYPSNRNTISDIATDYLGIDDVERVNLFVMRSYEVQYRAAYVPSALRWMAETGIVDWKKALDAVIEAELEIPDEFK